MKLRKLQEKVYLWKGWNIAAFVLEIFTLHQPRKFCRNIVLKIKKNTFVTLDVDRVLTVPNVYIEKHSEWFWLSFIYNKNRENEKKI